MMKTKRYLSAATTVYNATFATATSRSCNTMSSTPSYSLIEKWRHSKDSWLLRFALPSGTTYLGKDPLIPTCISVHHNDTLENNDEKKALLKKSYSPISHPATVGHFDILVKSYPPVPGGGVGDAICNIQIGQALTGTLKAERIVHGSPIINQRWDRIGLVGGGTGIAPLIQLARICLDDPDDNTMIYLLFINRNEDDILMKDELDRLAREHPDQLVVNYSSTGGANNVRKDWEGLSGRGSLDMARETLPPPSDSNKSTQIFVCGTDGFRDFWGGPVDRAPPKADGKKGAKIQGELLGILKEAEYPASDVFKY